MRSPIHYVIQDPYHEYGMPFVEHIYRKTGHRAVCIYTNRRERVSYESTLSQLRSTGLAAAYDVNLAGLKEFAAVLKARYNVAAIIPFNETSVTTAADLAGWMGLSWAQPEVMRRFRDKFALKEHLRNIVPSLRINASEMVKTIRDVLSLRERASYRSFVLKPNDGYGNRNIGTLASTPPVVRLVRETLGLLADAPSCPVRLKAKRGMITLSGEVSWEHQRTETIRAVRKLPGVRGVVNQMTLKSSVSPRVLKSKIEAALKRGAGGTARIDVAVCGAEITLSGAIHSESACELAGNSAWATPGVRNVIDHMTMVS
jgi:hypothetical protein